jgi:hypothetical protein
MLCHRLLKQLLWRALAATAPCLAGFTLYNNVQEPCLLLTRHGFEIVVLHSIAEIATPPDAYGSCQVPFQATSSCSAQLMPGMGYPQQPQHGCDTPTELTSKLHFDIDELGS